MAKARILIIEDEAIIAMLLEDIIEKAGYVCAAVCTTAETALATIEKTSFDAALMNLVLKGRPAYEVCAALAVREIPFAFASGVMQSAIEPLWQNRLYISKPFSEAEVCSTLTKLLAKPDVSIAQVIDQMPPPVEQSPLER